MWHHFIKSVGVSVLTVFCTVCLLSLPLLLLPVTLCQNTHMLTPSFTISLLLSILPLLPHPSLSALFILFSGGEGWCEHNGLCISPQLWDRGRQENCHRFWNRYPVWLRPVLLVRRAHTHTHTHISCFFFSHMQTKFSCYIYLFGAVSLN